MNTTRKARTRKLVEPGLQIRLTLYFAGFSALSLFFQYLTFTNIAMDFVAEQGFGGSVLEEMNATLIRALIVSLAVVFPLTVLVGILVTFKVAGPIHRLRSYLQDLAAGQATGECVFRKGDLLQGFCRQVNETTKPLRDLTENAERQDHDLAA